MSVIKNKVTDSFKIISLAVYQIKKLVAVRRRYQSFYIFFYISKYSVNEFVLIPQDRRVLVYVLYIVKIVTFVNW